jgi:hypothetical protein
VKLSRRASRQIIDLYLENIRKMGPFSHRPAAKKFFERRFRPMLKWATKKTGVLEYFEDRGVIQAAFFLWKEQFQFANINIQGGTLLCNPRHSSAKKWTLEAVERHRAKITAGANFNLNASLGFLLPELERRGFYTSDVILVGSVDKGLKALRRKYPDLDGSPPPGFEFQPITSERQLKAALSIYKKEFGRNPQFGRFCAKPGFLNYVAKQCRQSMKAKVPSEFVMLKEKQVVGHLSCSNPKYFAHLRGKRSGFGLTFDQSVQGKGYSKYYYYFLLLNLQKQGIKYYQGGTAQKPVLKLAKLMKRWPTSYILCGEKYFGHDHFRV